MSNSDQQSVRDAVLQYCLALNEWEATMVVMSRIEQGKRVSETQRNSAQGLTRESHLEAHAQIFHKYVVPRERKYGSNPGEPKSWGQSFSGASAEKIRSVTFPNSNRAELIADWGNMLPVGQTLFVLKKVDGQWKIDSMKHRHSEKSQWRTDHL